MKTTIKLIFCFALLVGLQSCKEKGNQKVTALVFSAQDSGFFTKKECFNFLNDNALTDSETDWKLYAETDTVGRYYRISHSNNYLAYFQGVVTEVSPNGKLIKGERMYGNGTYCYCLENEQDKFRKIGNYFCVTLGQTGSGYYACHYQFFKSFPAEDLQTIPGSYWYNAPGCRYQHLESKIKLKGDTLTMHYTFDEGDVKYNDKTDKIKTLSRSKRKFDVTYIFKGNNWTTTENHKFDGLEIDL